MNARAESAGLSDGCKFYMLQEMKCQDLITSYEKALQDGNDRMRNRDRKIILRRPESVSATSRSHIIQSRTFNSPHGPDEQTFIRPTGGSAGCFCSISWSCGGRQTPRCAAGRSGAGHWQLAASRMDWTRHAPPPPPPPPVRAWLPAEDVHSTPPAPAVSGWQRQGAEREGYAGTGRATEYRQSGPSSGCKHTSVLGPRVPQIVRHGRTPGNDRPRLCRARVESPVSYHGTAWRNVEPWSRHGATGAAAGSLQRQPSHPAPAPATAAVMIDHNVAGTFSPPPVIASGFRTPMTAVVWGTVADEHALGGDCGLWSVDCGPRCDRPAVQLPCSAAE